MLDFLLTQKDAEKWQMWEEFKESLKITESDFTDYLENLEDYEQRLARGEIQWQKSKEEMWFYAIQGKISQSQAARESILCLRC